MPYYNCLYVIVCFQFVLWLLFFYNCLIAFTVIETVVGCSLHQNGLSSIHLYHIISIMITLIIC